MKTTWQIGTAIALAAVVWIGSATWATYGSRRPAVPAYESDGFTFELEDYKATVSHEFSQKIKDRDSDYEVQMGGIIKVPENRDIVCISTELHATRATDKDNRTLLWVDPRAVGGKPAWMSRTPKYSAVLEGKAETKLKRVKLTGHPYLLDRLVVRGSMIIAEARENVEMPAQVTDKAESVKGSVKLRISSMRIDNQRMASFTVEYERPSMPGATFLEKLHALDDRGNVIGGGRWNYGNGPFGDKGQFRVSFPLLGTASIAKVQCVLVTKSQMKTIDFTIDEVFQR